jgi:ubiquitin-like-conjugating enzyme ATG3
MRIRARSGRVWGKCRYDAIKQERKGFLQEEADECGVDAEIFIESHNESIVTTRTYDITITYDKYYQTPRVWLFGYDEVLPYIPAILFHHRHWKREQNRNPLTMTQMMEDISSDHANKTVTVESHPHIYGISCASIHPCKHAPVIKTIIDRYMQNGAVPDVRSYMFWFLKLISSVIPTINYDFTIDVQK